MKLSLKLMIAVTLCALNLSVGWAQRQYPGSPGLPEDVVWMREIYRTLDLTKDTNGALYYPVEPQGNKMNLFATVFRLLAQKKIPAYEYQLDGTERFQKDAEVTFRDVLDRFQIYYELKKVANRRDSVLSISNSDIPSADVLSYFVKEVWYFDQRTSTYGSVITAICPVLHRSEEFSSEKVKLPMFWVNYKDIAPYLNGAMVMASNFNNVANRSMDDFFVTRQYNGEIYKTTNLQNRPLAEYCKTDSAMMKEQKRIETELVSFEKHLYGSDTLSTVVKPAIKEKVSAKKTAKAAAEETAVGQEAAAQPEETVKTNSKKKGREKTTSTSSARQGSKREAAAPKASVRRQRR